MDDQEAKQEAINPKQRREQALRMCAPGTALRTALDMIIAGHLGALITIGGFLGDAYDRSRLYDPTFTHMFRQGTDE